MSRAIILDYEDGSVNILPIPEDTPESRECEYVESHPCYDSSSMSYMIVGDSADVFEVSDIMHIAHLENGIVCHEDRPIFTKVGEL